MPASPTPTARLLLLLVAILGGWLVGSGCNEPLVPDHDAPPGRPIGAPHSEAPQPARAKVPLPADPAHPEIGRPTVLAAYASLAGHRPMPAATPGCWRLGPGRREQRHSLEDYIARNPMQAEEGEDRIVLQPLGDFTRAQRAVLETMRRYASVFFDCKVTIAPDRPLPTNRQRERRSGGRRWVQSHSVTLMDRVLSPNMPAGAICYLGITMSDLYPEAGWNYVFGQAYLHRRFGVYSLARYEASFWGEKPTAASRLQLLRRSCQVLVHETGHMFSIEHCLHAACTMNGSNSLEESDSQPLWLCPVCASKLTWNRGFDPLARYQKLDGFFREIGLTAEADWYRARAAEMARRLGKE